MLIMRDEQVKALDDATLRAFEDELVRHIQGFAPRHAQVIGESGVRVVIRSALPRAARQGWTNRGPIRFYVELMFMFGSEFDTDPLHPWAGAVLNDGSPADQMERADRLHAALLNYLERVSGPDDAYALAALRRIHDARPEDYPVSAGNFEAVALGGLHDVYPERCAYLGEPVLRGLIRRGQELARRHAAYHDLGVALFIALPFALGHGFDRDPLFPWVSSVLNDPRITDPARRVERLHARVRTYLGEALAYFERR